MEWKKNIFCVLAISLSTFNSLAQSQNISLNFSRRDIVLTDPVSSTIYLASRTKTPNSYPIQTLNGEIIRSYSIYKFLLQPKPDLSKYDSINLLIGYSKPNLIMMVDKDRDNSFSNDTIYKTNLLKKYSDRKDFRNNLPIIKTDSVRIVGESGNIEYKGINLRFSPSPGNGSFYNDTTQLSGIKKFTLELYSLMYFISDTFLYKGVKYQLKIIPDPAIYSFYPLKDSRLSRATILLLKYPSEKKFIASGILENLIESGNSLKFDDNRLSIIKSDFTKQRLAININSLKPENKKIDLKTISNVAYFNVANRSKVKLPLTEKRFTIFEFSGSWCHPCVKIIPEVRKIQKEVKDLLQFITVVVEKDRIDAIRFLKKYNLDKNTFYQNIDCNTSNCLTKVFSVSAYPTFIVVDNTGSVLFRETGDNVPEKLSFFLRNKSLK